MKQTEKKKLLEILDLTEKYWRKEVFFTNGEYMDCKGALRCPLCNEYKECPDCIATKVKPFNCQPAVDKAHEQHRKEPVFRFINKLRRWVHSS